jgi:citrate lyase subunit beta/citryl-CoA lyase
MSWWRDASTAPPRRSVHFVPGGNDKFLAKALASAADTVVFDLEDSVPLDRKDAARAAVANWLGSIGDELAGIEPMVRINALDTPFWRADVDAVVAAGACSLMVPKISSAAELDDLDDALGTHDPDGAVTCFPVATETARAVFHLPEIGAHRRVDGICWGAEDLSAVVGSTANRGDDGRLLPLYETVRHWCLLGARAAGVQAVDSVYTDLRDLDGLRRECAEAAMMGFDGKLTIHPDQIDIVNAAFTPAAAAVDEARELLAAFEASQAAGRLAFTFRGQMVDAPHLARARRLIARADATA